MRQTAFIFLHSAGQAVLLLFAWSPGSQKLTQNKPHRQNHFPISNKHRQAGIVQQREGACHVSVPQKQTKQEHKICHFSTSCTLTHGPVFATRPRYSEMERTQDTAVTSAHTLYPSNSRVTSHSTSAYHRHSWDSSSLALGGKFLTQVRWKCVASSGPALSVKSCRREHMLTSSGFYRLRSPPQVPPQTALYMYISLSTYNSIHTYVCVPE